MEQVVRGPPAGHRGDEVRDELVGEHGRDRDLVYSANSDELTLEDATEAYGPLPWTLEPGEQRPVRVTYRPTDDTAVPPPGIGTSDAIVDTKMLIASNVQ